MEQKRKLNKYIKIKERGNKDCKKEEMTENINDAEKSSRRRNR